MEHDAPTTIQIPADVVEAYKLEKEWGTHSENHVYEKGGLGAHSDVHSCKIQFNKFSEISKRKIYKLKSSEQCVNILQCSPKNLQ